jgi:hypothetical protein
MNALFSGKAVLGCFLDSGLEVFAGCVLKSTKKS